MIERRWHLSLAAFPILLPMLLAAACSPQAAESVPEPSSAAQAVHRVSGLQVIPVTVTSGTTQHMFRAELADSREAQARGLMFRTEMGADEAMIFPYTAPEMLSFWMRNTVLPLDIIFIDPQRRIINIEAGVPYNEVSVRAERPAIAVLELNAGRAEALGIAPGDQVEW